MGVWDEAKHRRAKAGASGGGQFISYDASQKTGTGYNKKEGDSRVKRLQRALNVLGLEDVKGRNLDVDGMLGPLTTQSVKSAQRRLGMEATGRVTPQLLHRLEAAARKRRAGSTSTTMDALIRRKAHRS